MTDALQSVWIGATLLAALAARSLASRMHLPRVTLLLTTGAPAGPEGHRTIEHPQFGIS